MVIYFTGASIVFGLLLNAFIKDSSTPKTHFMSWAVLIVASLFWFITLPSIVRKQIERKGHLSPIALLNQIHP
jgi:hypothetical protein